LISFDISSSVDSIYTNATGLSLPMATMQCHGNNSNAVELDNCGAKGATPLNQAQPIRKSKSQDFGARRWHPMGMRMRRRKL
jgi:hypothetical protein